MNDKIELLKNLIEQADIALQEKRNLITRTLQKTDNIKDVLIFSTQILDEDLEFDFHNLKERAIDNLVEAFSKLNAKKIDNNSIIIVDKDEDEGKDNRTQRLEYELRTLKSQMESIEYNSKKQLNELEKKNKESEKRYKELEEKNNRMAVKLKLTSNSKLIEVSDEDINELYIKYLVNNETSYNEAFVLNNVIPKTYYKIK